MTKGKGYSNNDTIILKKVEQEDLAGCMLLIKELAEYEKALNEVNNTLEQLIEDLNENKFDAFIAKKNNSVIGMALYFPVYSTWKGASIHLEDLVVKIEERRNGVGTLLFDALVNEAKKQKVGRLQWQVLDWNEPAINFYKKYPSTFEDDWINVKISNKDLQSI